jgi:hypothetical protein
MNLSFGENLSYLSAKGMTGWIVEMDGDMWSEALSSARLWAFPSVGFN